MLCTITKGWNWQLATYLFRVKLNLFSQVHSSYFLFSMPTWGSTNDFIFGNYMFTCNHFLSFPSFPLVLFSVMITIKGYGSLRKKIASTVCWFWCTQLHGHIRLAEIQCMWWVIYLHLMDGEPVNYIMIFINILHLWSMSYKIIQWGWKPSSPLSLFVPFLRVLSSTDDDWEQPDPEGCKWPKSDKSSAWSTQKAWRGKLNPMCCSMMLLVEKH